MTNSQDGSAILYQTEDKTVFLIDIPTSIAQAQDLSFNPYTPKHENQSPTETSIPVQKKARAKHTRKRYLISAPPRQTPYPSTEPKTDSARARVLETIPLSERRFHGDFIQPLVRSALERIRVDIQDKRRRWCLPRRVLNPAPDNKRKRERRTSPAEDTARPAGYIPSDPSAPPTILSPSSTNAFTTLSDLDGPVTNPSSETALLSIGPSKEKDTSEYTIPPHSTFLNSTLPLTEEPPHQNPIPLPGIPPTQKFNLLLFDPPWPNRSVRRGGHYEIHPYAETDLLAGRLRDILRLHAYGYSRNDDGHAHTQPGESSGRIPRAGRPNRSQNHSQSQSQSEVSLAGIWITNSEKARRTAYQALRASRFRVCEEWVWVKITADGRPVSRLDGLWRRPYEILVIGRREESLSLSLDLDLDGGGGGDDDGSDRPEIDLLGIDPSCITRRVLAAVPDLHSRKPNLRAVFEEVFFRDSSRGRAVESYSALEVFARNLTAGWWACGNEVLKFNARECWTEGEEGEEES